MPEPLPPLSAPSSAAATLVPSSANPRHCPTCGARYPADFMVCPRDATRLEDAPEDEDPLIGQVLAASYEVTGVIGEGGMGRVYKARHTRLKNKGFAVKVLHHELARQPEVVTRFQREAEAASGLAHPNVVAVHDVNTTPDGQPYLVAELLEGESFGEYLERVGKLRVPDGVRIVRQICAALAAAHSRGIVHRDMKPENVFLSGDAALIDQVGVKVLDFGISKVADAGGESLTKTGVVMGTPDYMPPEQARGDRVDSRADIYATGAILYRALTGRKPFEELDPMATLTAVLVQEPARPTSIDPEIPLALELVIQRAMAKSPADRYPTMEELDRDLAAFDQDLARLSTAPTLAPPPTLPRAAKTLLTRVSPRSLRDALEHTTNAVAVARPGILLFTFLGVVWLFSNVVVATGASLRLIRPGTNLSGSEVVLLLVGVTATLVTPAVLWIRYLRREVWPSTPKSVAWMTRLRTTVLYSSAAYGIAALFVQLFEIAIERSAESVAHPGWTLFTFGVGLVTALTTWFASRPKRAA
jgi:serine/threonine protein kinase